MEEQVRRVVGSVFTTFNTQTLDQFLQEVKISTYPSGQYLCNEGALERTFFIIIDGEVAVSKQRPDGTKELLQQKTKGDFFGEMALIMNRPRTADVYTTTDSRFVEMDLDAFHNVIRSHPEFLDNLTEIIKQYEENHRKLREYLVFTSYSRKDQDLVKRIMRDLRRTLRDTNIHIWFDQEDISPGKDWDATVEDALGRASAMLLFLSNNSAKSRNVKTEWSYCLDEAKIIIPVLIDKDCEIPFRLRPFHHIEMTEFNKEDSFNEGFERILRTLKEVAEQAENK